jgi:PAS domain S-box-containing protein
MCNYWERRLLFVVIFAVFIVVFMPSLGISDAIIRTGIIQLKPLEFWEKNDAPKGFYIDLIEEIARLEDWNIKYVKGSWDEVLTGLEQNNVDLMTVIGITAERERIADFSKQSALTVWGQIFIGKDSKIASILDLQNKKIAIMTRDINAINFKQTIAAFNVNCQFIEVENHDKVFDLVSKNSVDAGVAPNVFGYQHAHQYELKSTSIIFSPFPIHFAVRKNKNAYILERIDYYLQNWKKEDDSFYHRRIAHYFWGNQFAKQAIPFWLQLALLGVVVCSFLLFAWNRQLKFQVQNKSEELRTTEISFQGIFQNVFQFIWLLDQNGNLIDANKMALDFAQVEKSKITNQQFILSPWMARRDSKSQKEMAAAIDSAMVGIFQHFETYILSPEDLHTHVDFSLKPVTDQRGTVVLLIAEGRDISLQRKREMELTRFGTAFENTVEGVVITNSQGIIEYMNPAYVNQISYDQSETVGSLFSLLDEKKKDVKLVRNIRRIIESGLVWRGMVTSEFESGKTVSEDITISPIVDGEQKNIGFVSQQRDVTSRRRLEERLKQSEKMESLGNLAGGIAHDFNNILSAIILCTELAIMNAPKGGEIEENLNEVLRAGERASELVKQILTLSHRSEMIRSEVDIQSLLQEVVSLIRPTLAENIELATKIDQNCSLVLANSIQLHQVIMNLIINAKLALEGQGGKIFVSLEEIEGKIVITISDNGVGIKPENIERIFEPYFTTRDKNKGTGLGLAVVHGIVVEHGGTIQVKSKVGVGTEFTIHLLSKTPHLGAKDQIDMTPFRGTEHILIVDDEEINCLSMKKSFEYLGYQVTASQDSAKCLQEFILTPEKWDLVITDMIMPQLTGEHLARQMLVVNPNLPIILYTGFSSRLSESEALKIGILKYIKKPAKQFELAKVVRELLDLTKNKKQN